MKFLEIKFKFKFIAPLIFLITIFIVNFYFFNNSFFIVHDNTISARVLELHNTLKSGQFPPRWSQNLGFGYGMPLFEFYSPLVYFLAETFFLFNFTIINSIKISYILISIIGFLGTYFLSKKITNKWGSLLSAVAFSFSCYHAVNIYVRGAIAESLAISLFPWIFLFTLNLVNHNLKTNYIFLTISFVFLLLTHNISIITFFPFYFIFVFLIILKKKVFSKIYFIFLSFIHSCAISSFFLIPAFFQKNFTRVNSIIDGYFNFNNHFVAFKQLVTPNWGYGASQIDLYDNISFYIGNEILFIIFFLSTYYSYQFIKTKKIPTLFLILLSLFVFSIFLTCSKSKFLWQNIPLLNYIQFPWRYLGLTTFFSSVLVGLLPSIIKSKKIILVIILFIPILNYRFFKPETLIKINESFAPDTEYIINQTSSVIPDYLPQNIDLQNIRVFKEIISAENQEIKINTQKNNARQILAYVNSPEDSHIIINRFYFPNWQTKINNQKITCQIENNFYKCPISKGKNKIEFYWSEKGINQISNYLSIIGILFLIFISLKYNKSCKN